MADELSGRIGEDVLYDFQRADGSVYLRSAAYDMREPAIYAIRAQMVGEDGEVVGHFDTLGDLYRHGSPS